MDELGMESVSSEEWEELHGQERQRPDESALEFMSAAIEGDWELGTKLLRVEMAEQLGWSRSKLLRVIRYIKENPEWGISVSTSRGARPMTFVSFDGDPLPDASVGRVRVISEAQAKENLKRVIRSATTSFVAYNHANKTRSEARKMKPYVDGITDLLYSIRTQARRDKDHYGVLEATETALALVGVHFDGNESS